MRRAVTVRAVAPVWRVYGRAAAMPVVLLLSACASDSEPASAACQDAVDHADLPWLQANVFTPGCAGFASCHRGATGAAAGLSLEDGRSHASLVGVASRSFPSFRLVEPGQPDASYLLIILGHRDGPRKDGVGLMPLGSPPLCAEKRDAIERWIRAGAAAQ